MQERNNENDILKEYDCGHFCRVCPFPGAKCRNKGERGSRKREPHRGIWKRKG